MTFNCEKRLGGWSCFQLTYRAFYCNFCDVKLDKFYCFYYIQVDKSPTDKSTDKAYIYLSKRANH